MVLPKDLVPEITEAKGFVDWSSALEQLTLAEFISSGAYDRHVRSMRSRYQRRRDQLVATLAQRVPAVRVTGMAAGLQAVIELPHGAERSVVAAAADQGLSVSGLAEYRYEVPDSGWQLPDVDALVVGYAAPSDSAWPGALDALCRALAPFS
jgi:GntR family transcriptional regulator/MocR family aminotransferase